MAGDPVSPLGTLAELARAAARGGSPGAGRLLDRLPAILPLDGAAILRFDPRGRLEEAGLHGAFLEGSTPPAPPGSVIPLARAAQRAAGKSASLLPGRLDLSPLETPEGVRRLLLSSILHGGETFALLGLRLGGRAFSPAETGRFTAAAVIICQAAAIRRLQDAGGLPDPSRGLAGGYALFHETLSRELSRSRRAHRSLTVGLARFSAAPERPSRRAAVAFEETCLLLKGQLREFDTMARYGRMGLALVLPELSGGDAVRVLQRVLRGASPTQHRENVLTVGVACYPEDGGTTDRLIEVAEAALNEGLEAGRAGPRRWRR